MNCQRCRTAAPEGANFCPQCGKKLSSEQKKRRTKSRGNGTGTAFKRGDTWTAQVVIDYRTVADDKPRLAITRSKGGFKTRDAALQYCPILKAGPQKPKEAPTLEHYWERFKAGHYTGLGKSKQQAARTAWKKLEAIKDTRIDQLTVEGLQTIVGEKGTSYYTCKDMKTLLQHLFDIAAAEGYVRQELPSFISLPPLEETEQTPFSETEQKALWKIYEDGDIRAAAPLLMIYTGMMPGEAMRLRVDQIDIEGHRIHGVGMKTKVRKQNDIVLAETIIPLVHDLIDHAQPSGYIWKRFERVWYQNYHDVLKAAGCRDLPPYSCRHTTASALAITKNIAPQTVKKVMRWSSTKMLDRYAHPDQDDALAAVNTLQKAR